MMDGTVDISYQSSHRTGGNICDSCHSPPQKFKELKLVRFKGASGEIVYKKICPACIALERKNADLALCAKYGLDSDDVSRIRLMVREARQRSKAANRPFWLTGDDVAKLWVAQGGICALTGKKMRLGDREAYAHDNASIDRVDSLGSYRPDNIQIICGVVNMAKGTMTTEEFVSMCAAVVSHAVRQS